MLPAGKCVKTSSCYKAQAEQFVPIVEQSLQQVDESAQVSRLEEITVLAVADNLFCSTAAACQGRKPVGHSLQVDDTEAFVGERHGNDVALLEKMR